MTFKQTMIALAAFGLVFGGPAAAQTRASMALPALAQGVTVDECLVRPNIPDDVRRDRNSDGLLDDCAKRAARAERASVGSSSGSAFSPALIVGLLALVGALLAAVGGGGGSSGGGGNDSPG